MKRWSSLILTALVLVAFLAGCGQPKIDASTDDAWKTSTDKVRQSLPADQQKEFDQALGVLMFSQIDIKGMFSSALAGNTPVPDEVQLNKIRGVFQGKTGPEIIAEAKTAKEKAAATATAEAADAAAKRAAEALKEIADLEQKRAKSEAARGELAKFQVVSSRFYKETTGFMTTPVLELIVKNSTQYPISRAYFTGTLASSGRSVPWIKAPFNYQIPGGLEPGEQVTWQLQPNMFSDWGKVEAPADAVLTVTVDRLDGADSKPLFSTMDFTDDDKKRLDTLKQQYGQP